jgi:hypothetical protein
MTGGQQVVQPETETETPRRAPIPEGRKDKGERSDHSGQVLEEQRALPQSVPNQPPLQRVLEVAQAAMDQLGGATRGLGGELLALDEMEALDAACREVMKDPYTMDPAAHDQDIEVHVRREA